MWGLIVAACIGVFGSMFGLGSPLEIAAQGMSREYREEYSSSYFESGFQKNQESGTLDVIGQTKEKENTSQERVFIPKMSQKVDISRDEVITTEQAETDAMTVLSGN